MSFESKLQSQTAKILEKCPQPSNELVVVKVSPNGKFLMVYSKFQNIELTALNHNIHPKRIRAVINKLAIHYKICEQKRHRRIICLMCYNFWLAVVSVILFTALSAALNVLFLIGLFLHLIFCCCVFA